MSRHLQSTKHLVRCVKERMLMHRNCALRTMSRRAASPPPQDEGYLSQFGNSFMVAGAPSTDDHHYQEQSRSAPSFAPVHPSDIYGRPSSPSEVAFNFSDDATIHPDDSVSQLDRRFTGRRTMAGPRPMESTVPAIPSIPEAHNPKMYQYVPPAMLQDDQSTIVARGAEPSRAVEAPRAPPVQSYTPRAYVEEEEYDEQPTRGTGGQYTSSAAAPLVPGSNTGRPEAAREGGSGVSAYQPPVKGYAAVGREDEEDQAYSAYSRARDPDLEASIRNVRQVPSDGPTLASAWSNPLGYLKKARGESSYGDSQKDSYPPSAYGMDEVGKSSGPPSINIVEQQDQDPALMRSAPYWQRILWDRSPNAVRVAEHKRGEGIQKRPWASWGLSVIFCVVMIVELVRMAQVSSFLCSFGADLSLTSRRNSSLAVRFRPSPLSTS